ncbi:hypothetical protein [Emcibacter nanhaiensis]|uniref:HTH araC/xylS-type domain-containing protein n=1 Tax=Emcibacter nanhaiensis TaxID=1505037 RepID=A0A501PJ17_9PROT|nr:hypothetical protein [Emcibacter nanhaiensis]TPD60215.1 hypothetical protein FIV46_09180 [Emcibacter nanhaiensis]
MAIHQISFFVVWVGKEVFVRFVLQRQSAATNDLANRLHLYIGQNFRVDNITPSFAANALGCSLWNIHKICQNMGTTFGKLLLEARLSAAFNIG